MSNLDYRMGARHARDTLMEVGSRAVAKDTTGLKETARNMAEAKKFYEFALRPDIQSLSREAPEISQSS